MGFYKVFGRLIRGKRYSQILIKERIEALKELPGITVHYQWRKKKTLSLRVLSKDRVEVRSPVQLSMRTLRAFVVTHLDWIRRRIELAEKRRALSLEWEHCIFFMGRECGGSDEDSIRSNPRKWYRKQAMSFLPDRVWELFHSSPLPKELHVSVSLRWMKKRWGSCRSDGRITLNTALMVCPPHLIDYVILHELAHLAIPAHNADFYQLLENWLPGARLMKKELNERWSLVLSRMNEIAMKSEQK